MEIAGWAGHYCFFVSGLLCAGSGVFLFVSGLRDSQFVCLVWVFFSPPSFYLAEPVAPDVDRTGDASRAGDFFLCGVLGFLLGASGICCLRGGRNIVFVWLLDMGLFGYHLLWLVSFSLLFFPRSALGANMALEPTFETTGLAPFNYHFQWLLINK